MEKLVKENSDDAINKTFKTNKTIQSNPTLIYRSVTFIIWHVGSFLRCVCTQNIVLFV